MNFSLNINSDLWTYNLLEQILRGEETHVVVMEVVTPLNPAVDLHPTLKEILKDAGVVMALQIITKFVRFATR